MDLILVKPLVVNTAKTNIIIRPNSVLVHCNSHPHKQFF